MFQRAVHAVLVRVAFLPCLLSACTPALDWREVRLPDSQLKLLMPCKPVRQERRISLAGQEMPWTLHVCSADGVSWAVGTASLQDPAKIPRTLAALAEAAQANLGSGVGTTSKLHVPGATVYDGQVRRQLKGQRSDGAGIEMQLAVFARGLQVYQVSVLAAALPEEAAETFIGSLRFLP